MILRLWNTKVEKNKISDYRIFEKEISLPMFKMQDGIIGVFFLCKDDNSYALSLWENMEYVKKLKYSESYNNTVAKIMRSGLLIGKQEIDIFEVTDSYINIDNLTYEL